MRLGCKWIHCQLDEWQMGWLRFQRFVFGGQLSTFDDLRSLADVVQTVFHEEARVEAEAPTAAGPSHQVAALTTLKGLGYPFEVPPLPPASSGSSDASGPGTCGGHCRGFLLASVRALAAEALPGAEVFPVGSFAWGVDTDGSDLDVIVLPPVQPHFSPQADSSGQAVLDSFVATLQRLQKDGSAPQCLQTAEWALYGQTTVPVLTLRVEVYGQLMGIDICAYSQLGSVRDAILFRHALAVTPELCTVLQTMKRWLRHRAVPSCREGGFPQVFWMRLAARCYQQTLSSGPPKVQLPSADGCIAEKEAPASTEDDDKATEATEEDEKENEVRQHLRGLCARWSLALPAWGEPLNLHGEDPCGAAKRLATGVYGATALLCMRELRSLAAAPRVEDLPPVSPHSHLVPAQAGYWAAFLLPKTDDAEVPKALLTQRPETSKVVAAWVGHAAGDPESVRHSVFVKDGLGCNSMLEPAGCPAARADPRLALEHRYVSRRDTDWVLWATVANEASVDNENSVPSMAPSAAAGRHLALAPPHFICMLEGDPASSPEAQATLQRLHELHAELPVATSLPPAYPLHRYSKRLLLRMHPKNGKKEHYAADSPNTDAKWGLQKR